MLVGRRTVLVGLSSALLAHKAHSKTMAIVTLPAYQTAPSQPAQWSAAASAKPLVVDCHAWSGDHTGQTGTDTNLADLVASQGWNFIRPGLGGPNNNPDTGNSQKVADGLRGAVNYAITNGNVDTAKVFFVGGSGGGFTVLGAALTKISPAFPFTPAGYFVFCPITDLVAWYGHPGAASYRANMEAICGTYSSGVINAAVARDRSPVHMLGGAHTARTVRLYAGVSDPTIPISQTVAYYNRWVDRSGSGMLISSGEQQQLERMWGPDAEYGLTVQGRRVLLRRQSGSLIYTAYDGGHEVFAQQLMADMTAAIS